MNSASDVVAIDLGGTNALIALVDADYGVGGRVKIPTDPDAGPDVVVDRIAEAVQGLVSDSGGAAVSAVGIGAPGPLDPESGVVAFAPNLGWHNVPLKEMLETRLSIPVFVGNDVNVGTLGEHRLGAGKGVSDLVGVFVGTGIGGGVITGGALHGGFNDSAGEVGHMVVKRGGPRCGCGNRGCWEAMASRTAINRRLMKARENGVPSSLWDGADKPTARIKSKALRRALAAGDELVTREMKRCARYLGIGAANLINLLSPEMIIFGGGVVEAMEDWLMPQICSTAEDYSLEHSMQSVQIVAAKLGDDAGILGCAVMARDRASAGSA